MSNEQEWSTEFYSTEDGTSPVREFLEGLDDKTQARFIWSIEQLRIKNVNAREPLVKHLDGKLWELRRGSDGNIFRVIYFFFTGRKIVFLHGFQKKADKTPRQEIDIAQKRMDEYISREESENAKPFMRKRLLKANFGFNW
jgi:phage-related protein